VRTAEYRARTSSLAASLTLLDGVDLSEESSVGTTTAGGGGEVDDGGRRGAGSGGRGGTTRTGGGRSSGSHLGHITTLVEKGKKRAPSASPHGISSVDVKSVKAAFVPEGSR
jgi:hypothetical protein